MRLGDLLIEAGLVSPEEVFRALDRLVAQGGRLGDNLVAIRTSTSKCSMPSFIASLPSRSIFPPAGSTNFSS